jgi:hypothetical protein
VALFSHLSKSFTLSAYPLRVSPRYAFSSFLEGKRLVFHAALLKRSFADSAVFAQLSRRPLAVAFLIMFPSARNIFFLDE